MAYLTNMSHDTSYQLHYVEVFAKLQSFGLTGRNYLWMMAFLIQKIGEKPHFH